MSTYTQGSNGSGIFGQAGTILSQGPIHSSSFDAYSKELRPNVSSLTRPRGQYWAKNQRQAWRPERQTPAASVVLNTRYQYVKCVAWNLLALNIQIGAQVIHPPLGVEDGAWFTAVVGNVDANAVTYISSMKVQTGRKEVIKMEGYGHTSISPQVSMIIINNKSGGSWV
ncbi:hypothetical protein BDN72DRAFT_897159 [Pluteus cervinus]|uniref:Uncharacterized protein n=1 Tax=Pluteus cervinus TaxID=181527 RepID=A0ACD3AW65_9AGAR|nr:hypothetical protein BDN72DRAFT_897159 [Pluteus cervinus]